MLTQLIKKVVQQQMNGESNSSFAMAGNRLEDACQIPDLDHSLSAPEKADLILSQMTLEEKIEMLGGTDNLAIKGVFRLNLPKVWCSDASAGVRCFQRATAFPVPIAMAATWNRQMIHTIGETIGEECRAKGISILLGPGVNIYRVPTCGRNFEYFGEDPYLAGALAVSFIQGVQSKGVITTVKHLACNNSEYDRHRMNSKVDERTLREIYLPAFQAAIKQGGTKSVMCAYNPLNGTWASENHSLLTQILRHEWGFDGFVISDWDCVYSTKGPLRAGLDLEMPRGKYLNPARIKPRLTNGTLTEADIDRPVRNLLKTFFEMGIYNRPLKDPRYVEYSDAHSHTSLEAAREAIVLLKNHNETLPLNPKSIQQIVVMGEMAIATTTCGGGSCNIKSHQPVSILEGIQQEAGGAIQVDYLPTPKNRIKRADYTTVEQADVVIVAVGYTSTDESECYEKSWELPRNQARLIRQAAALNPGTIVTLSSGGGLETASWLGAVPAVLHCFFLGEKGGTAIAEVLFGKVNPSGKLPFTMGKRWTDFETVKHYVTRPEAISLWRILGPQGNPKLRKIWDLPYGEGLMVGYRHFDTHRIEPQFPFGFGLSYSRFQLADVAITTRQLSLATLESGEHFHLSLKITNLGEKPGAEVVQLYVTDVHASLPRPEKELKGFEKVFLKPGASRTVRFTIGLDAFSFYDDTQGRWVAEPGDFRLRVGTSSRQISIDERVTLSPRLLPPAI